MVWLQSINNNEMRLAVKPIRTTSGQNIGTNSSDLNNQKINFFFGAIHDQPVPLIDLVAAPINHALPGRYLSVIVAGQLTALLPTVGYQLLPAFPRLVLSLPQSNPFVHSLPGRR